MPATPAAPAEANPLLRPTSASALAAGSRRSILDLEGCLGRREPPSTVEIDAAVADLHEADAGIDPMLDVRLPSLRPGQRCSVMDLAGCLAHRAEGPAPTLEELDDAIGSAVNQRYVRSFA
ncbi:hypothetical protein [Cupriavidus agavae]|uniref:hypothetical protein n=1 Tax=Cupriavidus agavae TaxID=1001822 RepID=UPI00102CC89C|nr:hypothetical protein [Cupriavidus agavae]